MAEMVKGTNANVKKFGVSWKIVRTTCEKMAVCSRPDCRCCFGPPVLRRSDRCPWHKTNADTAEESGWPDGHQELSRSLGFRAGWA